MDNEIHDLYIAKINRFNTDHSVIQVQLAKFINELIDSNNARKNFGRVKHVYIPYLSSGEEYRRLGTCVGFVRLTKYERHDEAAEFLWGKMFKGQPINCFVKKEPTRGVSLKNAYIANDTEDEEEEEFGHENVKSNEVEEAVAVVENNRREDLIEALEKERELRRFAESELKKMTERFNVVRNIYEMEEEKRLKAKTEVLEKDEEINRLKQSLCEMVEKCSKMEEEHKECGLQIKELKDENEELRLQIWENQSLAKEIERLAKQI